MPKYAYTQLSVMCYERRFYRLDQMRDAVEYLKLQPQTGFTGLVAETHVKVDRFRLHAQPMLQLASIVGKTPNQVWSLFDHEADRLVFGIAERFAPRYGI